MTAGTASEAPYYDEHQFQGQYQGQYQDQGAGQMLITDAPEVVSLMSQGYTREQALGILQFQLVSGTYILPLTSPHLHPTLPWCACLPAS